VTLLFLDADVVALRYVEASQSGVLNIAAAFGCPVVSSDLGEVRATVETRRLGRASERPEARAPGERREAVGPVRSQARQCGWR
jgi:hypothetical protein